MRESRFPVIPLFFHLLATSADVSSNSVDRIVGGAEIDIAKVPFMLSIREDGQHICGAGIVNENWAVTAAHCATHIVARGLESFAVRSGSSKWREGGALHRIVDVVSHEKYDSGTNDYDVSVFRVEPRYEFDDRTGPIVLPRNPDRVEKDWGLVAGWGYFLDFDPILSETLAYVILPLVPKGECEEDYAGRYVVTSRQVCYGFRQGGMDACKGDSGGPLVNKDNVLLGVTSWGDGCGEIYSPGVYTDAILLQDWIRERTKEK